MEIETKIIIENKIEEENEIEFSGCENTKNTKNNFTTTKHSSTCVPTNSKF